MTGVGGGCQEYFNEIKIFVPLWLKLYFFISVFLFVPLYREDKRILVDGVVGAAQMISIRVGFVANDSVLVAVFVFVLYFCIFVFLLIEETDF